MYSNENRTRNAVCVCGDLLFFPCTRLDSVILTPLEVNSCYAMRPDQILTEFSSLELHDLVISVTIFGHNGGTT